jgi:hypothetical protein
MSLQPIEPDDSRIEHKTATLNGNVYHYLYGAPPGGKYKATVFLVGFHSRSKLFRALGRKRSQLEGDGGGCAELHR